MDVPHTPSITADEVRAIARLAHLDFSPEETDRLTRELGGFSSTSRSFKRSIRTAIAPMAHVQMERLYAP